MNGTVDVHVASELLTVVTYTNQAIPSETPEDRE